MPEAETLYEYIYRDTAYEKDLTGKKILVTAGPTREAIDPVRYITNHSSGKMGYALARVAVAKRSGCYACHRTDRDQKADVCEDCSGHDCKGNVRGGKGRGSRCRHCV